MSTRNATERFVEHSDEQQLLAETVARMTRDAGGRAGYTAAARSGEHFVLWDRLAAAGYVGVSVPEEYGGGGLGVEELALVLEAAATEGAPMTKLIVTALVTAVLTRHGSEAQQTEWLPQIADGSAHISFAITEADAGTNSHRIQTSAERTPSGWRLRGSKTYISGVNEASAIIVVARTGFDAERERNRLSLFIVPSDAPGLARDYIPTELTSTERQFTLAFDDVEIPAEALIGDEGAGLRQAFSGLNPERIVVAAMCNGMTRYALNRAAEYAAERSVWGVPIGTHQAVAHPLALAYAHLQLARLATQRAARMHDGGMDAGEASNVAKLIAADTAVLALDRAIQSHGGNGVAREYGLADLWFTVRLQQNAPVSKEMLLNYFAQHGLGLPKSY
jgi:alkylation response protein AidB-like acyl-CoA dehydrogenase